MKELFIWACSKDRVINSKSSLLEHALELTTTSFVEIPSHKGLNSLDFCKEVIHPLSSKLNNRDVRYKDQTLVVMVYTEPIQFKNLSESTLDPKKIVHIFLIERGVFFQAYRSKALDTCPHGTLLTVDLPLFLSQLHSLLDKTVPVTFIARSVPFYARDFPFLMVVNGVDSSVIDGRSVRNKCITMFERGFGDFFSLQDQGRGDVTGDIVTDTGTVTSSRTSSSSSSSVSSSSKKDRVLPTCSTGFSNMDSHRYKSSRLTVLGHIRPFIRDGGLSDKVKESSVQLSKEILDSEFAKNAFNSSSLSKNEKVIRRDLVKQYCVASGGNPDSDLSWFRHDGESNLPVFSLGFHCDGQNCKQEGLNDVLVVSVDLPTNVLKSKPSRHGSIALASSTKTKKFSSDDLHAHVLNKGYTQEFPYTRVFYTKDMSFFFLKRLNQLQCLRKKSLLSSILLWGLMDTINSPLDYRGYVFDREDFPAFFEAEAKEMDERGSILQGKCLQLTPSFDKTGHVSLLLEVWNYLVTSFLGTVTVVDALHFGFFCTWTCNGTVIPWRISCEIAKNIKSAKKLLKDEKRNLFRFLIRMDERVADLQLCETGKDCPRTTGSCSPCRSQFSRISASTDWSGREFDIINCLNVAFFNGDRDKLLGRKWTIQWNTLSGHALLSKFIAEEFDGIGDFLCHSFISLLSLLGVFPLVTYKEATISDDWSNRSGVVKLTSACVPTSKRIGKTPNDFMNEFKEDFDAIMKNRVLTRNFLENQCCETWRIYNGKMVYLKKAVNKLKIHNIEVIKDNKNPGTSGKVDIYMWMPMKNGIQNLFHYCTSAKGFSTSSPGLVFKSPNHWVNGSMVYSDWNGPNTKVRNIPNLVYWDKENPNSLVTRKTKLVVTDALKELYKEKREQRKRRKTKFFSNQNDPGIKRQNYYNFDILDRVNNSMNTRAKQKNRSRIILSSDGSDDSDDDDFIFDKDLTRRI